MGEGVEEVKEALAFYKNLAKVKRFGCQVCGHPETVGKVRDRLNLDVSSLHPVQLFACAVCGVLSSPQAPSALIQILEAHL